MTMMLSPNLFSPILPLLYELRVNKRTFSQIFHKKIVEKTEGSLAVRTGVQQRVRATGRRMGGSSVCGQQGAGWAVRRSPAAVQPGAGNEAAPETTPPGGKKEAPRAVPTDIFPPGVHIVS